MTHFGITVAMIANALKVRQSVSQERRVPTVIANRKPNGSMAATIVPVPLAVKSQLAQ